jgi:hypothetical protein
MAGNKDVVFGFNKYKQAELGDRKTAIANAIINACFMVPGNNPSMPGVGVNIRQYFYKEQSAISSDKIRQDIEASCGTIICGATIGAVDFSFQKTADNDLIFLLIIMIKFSQTEQEILGITMKQKEDSYVKFNFDYIPI